MSGNELQNGLEVVAETMLARLENDLLYKNSASIQMEDHFKATTMNKGKTVEMVLPMRYKTQRGKNTTAQAIVQKTTSLTLDEIVSVHVEFDAAEKILEMDAVSVDELIAQPAIDEIINDVDTYVADKMRFECYQTLGSDSTNISSFADVTELTAYAKKLGLPCKNPKNAYLVLSPEDERLLMNTLQPTFNTELSDDITQRGYVGQLNAIGKIYQSPNLAIQEAGNPGAGPVTTTASVVSGNIIQVTGVSTSTGQKLYAKGDIINVAAASEVYSVNAMTRKSTGELMTFVVTADVFSSGAATANIPVSPEIITTGAYQNVSKGIPNGATIELMGTHRVCGLYDKNSLMFAAPPLGKISTPFFARATSEKTGWSLVVMQDGNAGALSNEFKVAMLCGARWNGEYAIRRATKV